jgi:hypothetical protein
MEIRHLRSPEAGLRPVLYLDLDDTLIVWADGSPRAAPGARQFVLWALERFEVRWLTTWCPDGRMQSSLLADLCSMLELDPAVLSGVRGFDWQDTGTKLNGIAWLEHLVWKRPFLWIEDQYGFGEREAGVLAPLGLDHCHRHCNVSEAPESLGRLWAELAAELDRDGFAWAPASRRVPVEVAGAA